MQEKVFRILGYTGANALAEHRSAFEASVASFARITDPEILGVEARRITIVELPRVMTVEEFEELFPSPGVSAEAVRLINQVSPGETLPAGLLMKRLTGGVR